MVLVEPENPWENGHNEISNGKLVDVLMNRVVSYALKEAQVLIERWRKKYNTLRTHSSLNYRLPAPETPITNILHPFILNSEQVGMAH